MLGALNGGTCFIKQRVSARDIPIIEGIKSVLACFFRVVVVEWFSALSGNPQ